MRKIVSWLAGFAIGAAIAAVIVMIFVPETGAQIKARLKAGYDATMEEARLATEKKRAELEAELAAMQNQRLPDATGKKGRRGRRGKK